MMYVFLRIFCYFRCEYALIFFTVDLLIIIFFSVRVICVRVWACVYLSERTLIKLGNGA